MNGSWLCVIAGKGKSEESRSIEPVRDNVMCSVTGENGYILIDDMIMA